MSLPVAPKDHPLCQARSCALPATICVKVCVGTNNWVETYLCPVHIKTKGVPLLLQIHESLHHPKRPQVNVKDVLDG